MTPRPAIKKWISAMYLFFLFSAKLHIYEDGKAAGTATRSEPTAKDLHKYCTRASSTDSRLEDQAHDYNCITARLGRTVERLRYGRGAVLPPSLLARVCIELAVPLPNKPCLEYLAVNIQNEKRFASRQTLCKHWVVMVVNPHCLAIRQKASPWICVEIEP